eukprot:gene9204-8971_t
MKNTHGSDVYILIKRDVIEVDSTVTPPVVHACAAAGASVVATKLTKIIKSLPLVAQPGGPSALTPSELAVLAQTAIIAPAPGAHAGGAA